MLESWNFSTHRGGDLSWLGSTALIVLDLLYLTVEMALLCFLNKSLVITGRFDGPSLILTLSAVKHLGKDNNSQFYDTVKMGGGHRGVSFLPLWSFRTVQRKKAVNLGQLRNHPALWNQPTCSLIKWSQVVFDVYKLELISPQLLALAQLCEWQGGHISPQIRATVRSCQISGGWGGLCMVQL